MKNPENKFLGQTTAYDQAKVVVMPVPLELNVSYGKGTKKGPSAILKASDHLEDYDIELGAEPARAGINTLAFIRQTSPAEKMLTILEKAAGRPLRDRKFLITLGGEHTLSIATANAALAVYPDLSILHFDAHTDCRKEYAGDPFSHACALYRIRERNKNTYSVGIRSVGSEELAYLKEEAVRISYARDIIENGFPTKKILDGLTEHVYISFDVDAFDPAVLEETGTPEPGGLQWYPTLALLKQVFRAKNVVGADIVELAPDPDHPAADFTAAKLAYKMIGYKFCQ